MSTSLDQIMIWYNQRRTAQGPMIQRARTLRDVYNGEVVIPVPQLEENEKSAVANLLQTGLDQIAMRVASTTPNLITPALRKDFKASEQIARTRNNVITSWWEANRLTRKMRRRSRWLLGYGSAPVYIRPDMQKQRAMWHPVSPIDTFPCPGLDPDEIAPENCIYTYTRSLAWLQQAYPDATRRLFKGPKVTPNDLFDMLEYNDADETVLAAVGKPRDPNDVHYEQGNAPYIELERIPNKAGMCLVVVPGRVTLDRLMGAFDGLIGLYEQANRLMALQVIAAQRGVFPDQWLVTHPGTNGNAEIVKMADGIQGQIGEIQGGTIETVKTDPAFTSLQVADRLTESMRQEGGIPAEFGGQSGNNIRTGKRGDSIMSATLDFRVQEAQEAFEYSLQEENKRAVAIDLNYWRNSKKTIYFGGGTSRKQITYTPADTWETDENIVKYALPGADAQGLAIEAGQRLGMKTMSRQEFMRIDPMVEDPDRIRQEILAEGLEDAVLASIQQQASQGAIPPNDIARIRELIRTKDMEIDEAVAQAHDEAQKRQASSGPPGTPEGPVPPGSPEAQPGLAAPGAGAEAPIAGPNQGQMNLADLLGNLKQTATQPQPGRPPVPVGA